MLRVCMYALVEILGKQYKAEKGSLLKVDRMDKEAGAKVEFESVLMFGGDKVVVGTPYVEGAKIVATVKEEIKDKKVTIFKFKRRKGYQRQQGHRQKYTLIQVDKIIGA